MDFPGLLTDWEHFSRLYHPQFELGNQCPSAPLLTLDIERRGGGLVAQSCLTVCDPMGCSPPGSSAYGFPQARILEWAAIYFSRGSSQPRPNPGFESVSFAVQSARQAWLERYFSLSTSFWYLLKGHLYTVLQAVPYWGFYYIYQCHSVL